MSDTGKKIKNKKKDIRPTGKQVWILTIFLCFCAIGFVILSSMDDARVEMRSSVIVSEDTGIVCYLGEVTIRDYIKFENCYAVMQGNSINTWDIDVVLEDTSSGEAMAIPTYMVETDAAKEYFAEGDSTYTRTGFAANIKCNRIDLSGHDYNVLLYYNNNNADMYVDTGYILTEKGIMK